MTVERDDAFRPCCLSLDLEVGKKDGQIQKFGAVRGETGHGYHGGGSARELSRLDALSEGAVFILGHNLIEFDLPYLTAAKPDLRLLDLPVIDTLRLSPLAFPRNPYHRLVKHYQDGGLVRERVNNPELDARLALAVFCEQREGLKKAHPDLLAAWHWLTTPEPEGVDHALDDFFSAIRSAARPSESEAEALIGRCLEGAACRTRARVAVAEGANAGWALAYSLAWLSVAGGDSVMPPWVRHQFPEAGRLVRLLRDMGCTDPGCGWCCERHDARKELKRWFGFDDFRREPSCDDGRPMQQAVVEEAMAGRHVLGILPTGTGKSLCYQIPAISRYDKTGALTVVISPLVALMADQVRGLERYGVECCVTVNGMLSMPERSQALDRVRIGGAGILLIAPEQLRSNSLRRAVEQREIGGWVLDEAHCLSRWGHDFRPDYRYVSHFIREKAGEEPIPPVVCLTATAKPDVREDIVRHFRERLDIELTVFDGGAERANLDFQVIPTTGGEKFAHIHQVLEERLPPDTSGGAIVYCATQRRSEEVAEFLKMKEVAAEHFHAGVPPESKRDVQERFIRGDLRAIAATNAFGMGIDKPDVRLVIHADIPGSLENYFQEAGRAGRDRQPACCVLLYAPDDVERQFGLSARTRLTKAEIQGVLKALHNLDGKKRFNGDVVATPGEILGEDEDKDFVRDSVTDDTRVRTAIAWLEEAHLVKRQENVVNVFPSSLRIETVEEARRRLERVLVAGPYRGQLLRIARELIAAGKDESVSTDELMALTGLSTEGVRGALYDLERYGVVSNDTAITAFVHMAVTRSSENRRKQAAALEGALIAYMREAAPDQGKGDSAPLNLRIASQALRDQGLEDPFPERLWRILRGIANDGRGEDGAAGSLSVRKQDAETARITLKREWEDLDGMARRRRAAAERVLEHLLAEPQLPKGSRGTDLLAETTLGKLLQVVEADMILKAESRDTTKLLDRALMWLHELEVIRLNKGLAVFRSAMRVRIETAKTRKFTKAHFRSLALHYEGQVLQVHVMAAFAQRGLERMRDAYAMARDYFMLNEKVFLDRWFVGRSTEIGRQTTPESWWEIVESLDNSEQIDIVANESDEDNVLVLAGPGSGKTRVLVHRIAYLIRVRRENARGILAVAYNRHAAVDIRRRLHVLIGEDARGVTVLTCHGLAMRLAGASFTGRAETPDDSMFEEVMRRAVALLRGEDLPPEEADEQRERLLAGFRWILVDEYQDIDAKQYDLISAVAGRTCTDEGEKLTVFAVGDDDQNVFAFAGASVEFIRRFKEDYGPEAAYLVGNYRSSGHIIEAANAVIEGAGGRMKVGHPIHVDKARVKERPGGAWEERDRLAQGRVQLLPAGRNWVEQAQIVMGELLRLESLYCGWDWSRCAVLARNWRYLEPVRAYCEANGIPVQMGDEQIPNFWRLRETRALVAWVRKREPGVVDGSTLRAWVDARPSGPWHDLLRQAIDEHALETGGGEVPVENVVEWLADWSCDVRRRQHGVLLTTAYRAKGLEFDHVAVLDGGWNRRDYREDWDAPRRVYYVAMTRARQTLMLGRLDGSHGLQEALIGHPSVFCCEPAALPRVSPELLYHHERPDLKEVDLGFAGRRGELDPIHRAISALKPGDRLQTRLTGYGRWLMRDESGRSVGQLAKDFKAPEGMRCRASSVYAVVGWSRETSEIKYRDTIKCDAWEVVVPELVFEPND